MTLCHTRNFIGKILKIKADLVDQRINKQFKNQEMTESFNGQKYFVCKPEKQHFLKLNIGLKIDNLQIGFKLEKTKFFL